MTTMECEMLHAQLSRFLVEHATERDATAVRALQQRLRRIMGKQRSPLTSFLIDGPAYDD